MEHSMNTMEETMAAIKFYSMAENMAKLTPEEKKSMMAKMKAAAKKFNIKMDMNMGEDLELSEKRLYEKQFLRFGEWKHPAAPGGKLKIDKNFAESLIANFNKSPFSPVVRSHVSYAEAEKNPSLIINKNIEGVVLKDDGVYAQFECDPAEMELYNDVSASIDPNGEDHETGKKIGPVLKHIAMVVNPYIKKLKPFVALADKDKDETYFISLSDISMAEKENQVTESEVVTTTETPVAEPTKEEVEQSTTEEVAETATAETVEEPKSETKSDEQKDINASDDSDELRKRIQDLEIELAEERKGQVVAKANNFYNDLLQKGKVTPAMEEVVVQLAEAGSTEVNLGEGTVTVSSLLEKLFDLMPQLVNLSEKGVDLEAKKSDMDLTEAEMEHHKKTYFQDHPNSTEMDFEEYIDANRAIIIKHRNNK